MITFAAYQPHSSQNVFQGFTRVSSPSLPLGPNCWRLASAGKKAK
jgi:hypothetical protein